MPSNVEIKAKVSDKTQFAEKAAELSQSEGTIIRQHDTFFNCSQGRLKLRDLMNESGQLIFYERPDTDGPKLSRYSISLTSDPASLRAVLSDALGVKGEVRKERRLFLIGQTRVHLDTVEGLGDFMELELEVCGGTVVSRRHIVVTDADFIKVVTVFEDIVLKEGETDFPVEQTAQRRAGYCRGKSFEASLKDKQVVMRPEQTVEEGQQVAEDLMEKLGVSKESLVTGAYMDLLLKGHKET